MLWITIDKPLLSVIIEGNKCYRITLNFLSFKAKLQVAIKTFTDLIGLSQAHTSVIGLDCR